MCEKKVPVLNSMIKNRNTRFLKSYTLNYTNTEGNEKLYEMVSNFDYEKPEEIGQNASGVVIVGFRDDELLLLREFRMGVNQFIYNMPAGHPLKSADSGYQEGEKLTVDELTFTVWHTPGHTEGGVVLLCGDYLFVGDTVFQGSIGRTDLEGGNMQKMDASLRKLAGLPIPKETQLLPGHGDFSTLGEELANNFYIRSALRGGNADF